MGRGEDTQPPGRACLRWGTPRQAGSRQAMWSDGRCQQRRAPLPRLTSRMWSNHLRRQAASSAQLKTWKGPAGEGGGGGAGKPGRQGGQGRQQGAMDGGSNQGFSATSCASPAPCPHAHPPTQQDIPHPCFLTLGRASFEEYRIPVQLNSPISSPTTSPAQHNHLGGFAGSPSNSGLGVYSKSPNALP